MADAMLTRLREALADHGLPSVPARSERPGVIDVEHEFVVHDSALELDAGWLDAAARERPTRIRRHRRSANPELRERNEEVGRRALRHVLTSIATAPLSDRLVLRGSATMPLWVGDRARHPRDLDFVVVPEDLRPFTEDSDRLVRDVLAAVGARRPLVPGLGFAVGDAEVDGIWDYEGVPGLRVALGWKHAHLPGGVVGIDLAFGEPLPDPPEYAALDGTRVLAATADLSLAWKIQWLYGEILPEAKDLRDAVLLAESGAVSRERVFGLLDELGVVADPEEHEELVSDLGHQDGLTERFEAFVAPWFGRS